MARITNIQLRRSASAGALPTTSQLDLGEIALNTYDGKAYMKKSVGGTESVVQIGSSEASSSDILKEFEYDGSDGTSSNTIFSGSDNNSNTLSYTVGSLQVYLNGILLQPSTDYTAANGTSITLVNAAAAADLVQIISWYKTIGTGLDTVQVLSGVNGSATAFTLSTNPTSENQTAIYIDGVYQSKTNYAIVGTALTFSTAPPAGTSVEVVTHSSNIYADNITNLTIAGTMTANAFAGNITGNVSGNVTGTTSSIANHDTGDLSEGSNLYYTNARADARITAADTDDLSEGSSNLYHTAARARGAISISDTGGDGSLVYNNSSGVITYTGPTASEVRSHFSAGSNITISGSGVIAGSAAYTNANARGAISVTDSGGDGSLAYNNSSGVITYTGPSAGEVRAHLSAGTGITYSGGAISIGQAVATTSDVTFNDIQVDGDQIITGNLTVNGTQTNINTATLSVEDLNITVGKLATTSSATNGAGLTFGAWSSGTIPTLTWDHSNTRFAMNKSLAANIIGNVTGNVTGNTSGTSLTVTQAAQTAITSLGSLTGLDVNGAVTINDNLSLDGSNKELRFYEGSNYVGFEAPALSADQIWVLPTADGSSGTALKTDGSGNLSWGTAGGNAFETIAVSGQSNIVADSTTDTLTFVGGTGITLTTAAGTDTLTITNSATGDDAFKTIAVSGQTSVVADSTDDTLTLVAGAGMAITTDASADSITISGVGTVNPFMTDLTTTANSSTTAYTISQTPANEDALMVFIEGVYQNKNSYTLSGTTLTLDAAPASGQEVVIHSVATGVTGTGHNSDQFTGNGSTAAYTLSVDPITENNCFVFFDGVYQNKSTFSTSGTTITFDANVTASTAIEVITPTITSVNVPTDDSVTPAKLSTGGPTWNTTGQVTIDSDLSIGMTVTSVTSGSTATICTLAGATYRSAKLEISITDAVAGEYESTEALIVHNGSAASITEYGTIFTGSAALGTITATYSSGNVLIRYTRTGSNTHAIKVKHSAIKV